MNKNMEEIIVRIIAILILLVFLTVIGYCLWSEVERSRGLTNSCINNGYDNVYYKSITHDNKELEDGYIECYKKVCINGICENRYGVIKNE